MLGHDDKAYEKRWSSFGWKAISIDGHDIGKIIAAFKNAKVEDKQ